MTHMVDWLTAQDGRGSPRGSRVRLNRNGIPVTSLDPGQNPFAPPPPPRPRPSTAGLKRGPSGTPNRAKAREEAAQRRCTDKKRYPTMACAEEAAQRHLDKHGEVKDPYECDRCKGCHIGESNGKKPPKR